MQSRWTRRFIGVVIPCIAFALTKASLADPAKPDDEAVTFCKPETAACGSGAHCGGQLSSMLRELAKPKPATTTGSGSGTGSAPSDCKNFDTLPRDVQRQCFDKKWADVGQRDCTKVALLADDSLVRELSEQQKARAQEILDRAESAARDKYNCISPTTLCLDRDGQPYLGSTIEKIEEGEALEIVVLSPFAADVGSVSLSLRGLKQLDTTTREVRPTEKAAGAGDVPPFELFEIASAKSEATAEDTRAVEVTFVRVGGPKRKHLVGVTHGKYFVELGLSVPFVYKGTRTLSAQTVVRESTEPRAAISAIVFLFGRDKDRVGYEPGLWSNFGLQLGTDFDFTKGLTEKDYHIGIAWEPIAGFGLGVGVSFVRGQYIPSGAAISTTTTEGMIEHDDHYMVRPYFAVFLTTKIVSAAQATITALKSSK